MHMFLKRLSQFLGRTSTHMLKDVKFFWVHNMLEESSGEYDDSPNDISGVKTLASSQPKNRHINCVDKHYLF